MATRNRRHRLRPFVEACGAERVATEIVVVLDGDVDGSYEELRELATEFPKLRPILAESGGQMAALERGAQASIGDVVLLMDDDVVARAGLVSGHARRHADTFGLVVLGYMPVELTPGSSVASRLYAQDYERHCRRLDTGELSVLDGLWLGNVSLRRDELVRVGIFSDRFPVHWHADTDFGVRLHDAGLSGVFDRQLQAAHAHSMTTAAFLRDAHQRGEAAWYLAREHAERFDAVRPASLLEDLPSFTRAVVAFLAHEGRSAWSSRMLMEASGWAERLRRPKTAESLARLARRILSVCGFRCGEAGRD